MCHFTRPAKPGRVGKQAFSEFFGEGLPLGRASRNCFARNLAALVRPSTRSWTVLGDLGNERLFGLLHDRLQRFC